MNPFFDFDLLKPARETIDWLAEKYKGITNIQQKSTLNEVANQISSLAVNKAAYLAALKQSLKSKESDVDLYKINSTIATAKSDTEKLADLLAKLDLDSSKFTFSLKHGLEKLTRLKQIKLNELEEIISENAVGKVEMNNIIEELESFENKWIELGKEIDRIVQEK